MPPAPARSRILLIDTNLLLASLDMRMVNFHLRTGAVDA